MAGRYSWHSTSCLVLSAKKILFNRSADHNKQPAEAGQIVNRIANLANQENEWKGSKEQETKRLKKVFLSTLSSML